MSPFESVVAQLAQLGTNLSSVTEFLAVVAGAAGTAGIVAMGLLDWAKDLADYGPTFTQRHFRRWLAARAARAKVSAPEDALFTQIVDLAAAGDPRALFDVAPATLGGHLRALGRLAATYPKRYPELVRVFAWPAASEGDLELVARTGAFGAEPAVVEMLTMESRLDAADAARRLSVAIDRSVDGFVLALERSWKLEMRLASMGVSMALLALPMLVGLDRAAGAAEWATWLAASVAGGIAAPTAKDFLRAIDAVRRGGR